MAICRVGLIAVLQAFTLISLFVMFSCGSSQGEGSQSEERSLSGSGSRETFLTGSGSEGGIESGLVYLVAPELTDCPANSTCDTLSSYSTMGTTLVSDVVFSFLPGIHRLSHTWLVAACRNITLRGWVDSVDREKEQIDAVDIVCESAVSESTAAIQVSDSDQVVVDGISISYCESNFTLFLESTSSITVNHVSITSGRVGLFACKCEYVTIKHSIFTDCLGGVLLDDILSGLIGDNVFISNIAGLVLSGCLDLEIARSDFTSNFLSVDAEVQQGNITLKHIFSQGSYYGLAFAIHPNDELPSLSTYIRVDVFNITVLTKRETYCGICIFFEIYTNTAINLQSVSVIGTSGGFMGILIFNSATDLGQNAVNSYIRIHNITIENMGSHISNSLALSNLATFLVFSFSNLTISDCTLKNNGVTGILLYDSTAFLQGNITLRNNSGINGGGMSLIANSFILLDSSTMFKIHDNNAEKFGGGIYASQDLLWVQHKNGAPPMTYCFALATGENFNPIEFSGNKAGASGQNLFGGSVQNCVVPTFNMDPTTRISTFGDAGLGKCNQTNISSDPIRLLPCRNYCVDDSEHSPKQYIAALFPGQDFSLRIAAVGQLNGLTPAIILFSSNDIILDETYPDTTQSSDTHSIDAQCTTVTQTLALREFVDEAVVYMTIADETLPSFVNTPIAVYVGVLPCPPGFNFSVGICDCTKSIQDLATCNITSESIQRNGNSWIYPRNDSIMIFDACPFDYCNNIAFPSDHPDEQCDHNRSGILCGQCIPGYSLMLGCNGCQNCTEQVWQLPLIVGGSVLAGIGLVAVLIAINLTVSVGTMNGLIFFANIVKIYEPIFLRDTFHPKLQFLISWLNLDLGITSCFIPGMTACVKVGLQFVFPMYLLSIVAFIIVICKVGQWQVLPSNRFIRFVSGKVTLLIGSKAIPVLATILLLSYTKLLRTTIQIFHKATVITTDCEHNISLSNCEKFVVWYVDGNINFTSNCHGLLFGVAVGIFSPLVVSFTSFLLFFPLMERYLPRFKCWSSWHMRLKPWYEAYGGPYKDEYRSWTGILLLVRCVLALVAALENDLTVNISVLAWVCFFLISLLSVFQMYKTFLLNSLEMMYLTCLLLIAFLSTTTFDRQMDAVSCVVLISLMVITLFHLFHQMVKLNSVQRQVHTTKKIFKNFGDCVKKQVSIQKNCVSNENIASSTFFTVESVQYNELREPLLEEEL